MEIRIHARALAGASCPLYSSPVQGLSVGSGWGGRKARMRSVFVNHGPRRSGRNHLIIISG